VAKTGIRSPNRRVGAKSSRTRHLIVQSADELLDSEGLAAITTSRISAIVGLKRPIVHYYFRTIEELIIAVLRRREAMVVAMLEEALLSDQPLNVFKTINDPKAAAAIHDMNAFALRSKAFRKVGRQCLETVNELQARALELELQSRKVSAKVSPTVVAMLMLVLNQALAVGATAAQPELERLVRKMLINYLATGDIFTVASNPNNKRLQRTPRKQSARKRLSQKTRKSNAHQIKK
jgi:TetR/AcrR family transcriptional regulator